MATNKKQSEYKDNPKERQQAIRKEQSARIVPRDGSTPNITKASTYQELMAQYRKRQQQKLSLREASQSSVNNWMPLGPSLVIPSSGFDAWSGRVAGIAIALGGERIYVATANGGVWRSDDSGKSWRSLMDAWDLNPTTKASDTLACGAIAIDMANPNRVYIGTGEGNADWAYKGVGPVVSFDGGENWQVEASSPSLAGSAFYALAVDPSNPENVLGATLKGLYRRKVTSSGAVEWKKITALKSDVTSVVVAYKNNKTVFFAARKDGPVYRSEDNGRSWQEIGLGRGGVGGEPPSNLPRNPARITLAVQPDNPDIVYALIQNGDIYRLEKSDDTWTQVIIQPELDDDGFGDYMLALVIAPDNPNRVYRGMKHLYQCDITVSTGGLGQPLYIATPSRLTPIHNDIHALVFVPKTSSGNPLDYKQLWVGSDGGLYYANNLPTTLDAFEPRNTGLATMTMRHMGQHPTEDAVLFCGTQDNGGQRYIGNELWLRSTGAYDAGYAVVNWADPYQIVIMLLRYKDRILVQGFTDGGETPIPRHFYLDEGESSLFYPPLVGTPYNRSEPNEAYILACGSIRPWISTNFGTSWNPIPNNCLDQDSLDGRITAMIFATATKLYVGTEYGSIYQFINNGDEWSCTPLHTTISLLGDLPLKGRISSIAIDSADTSHDSIYITFDGIGDQRHVWHYKPARGWKSRSGNPLGVAANALLDVQTKAIVVDVDNPSTLYVGTDIGVWRSDDKGKNWYPFSEGLPDAGVIDMKQFKSSKVSLLRAATDGRGVFERSLDDRVQQQDVQLYVRSTVLDRGLYPVPDLELPDPTQFGETVDYRYSPDVKFSYSQSNKIDFYQFATLTDESPNIHAYDTVNIYVQVHNRGIKETQDVEVSLWITGDVRNGTPLWQGGWDNWKNIQMQAVGVRPGFPQVVHFSVRIGSTWLPISGDQGCVLVLLNHSNDSGFDRSEVDVDVDALCRENRKVALKYFTVQWIE